MQRIIAGMKVSLVCFFLLMGGHCQAGAPKPDDAADSVRQAAQTVMRAYDIPGMAIAVTVNGKRCYYNYGVASVETRQPVTNQTIFEIGSISKTFTATLASYAEAGGKLSLADPASKFLPELRGSAFDNISLLHLATHTSGGLTLQVPENIENTRQFMRYLKTWQPPYQAGAIRTYSNQGIGLLGLVAEKSLRRPFADLLESGLFPMLGLANTYVRVPADRFKDYAQGYDKQNVPVRLADGVLAAEAYGVKSSAPDLLQYLEANMGVALLDAKLQGAIDKTHVGYYQAGAFTQDLVWEQYPYPVKLKQLLKGNSAEMAFDAIPSTPLNPPLAPQKSVLLNKTGSTGGFGAYIAFVPEKKTGIVILANKSYPIDARVTLAYQILNQFIGEE